MTSPSDIDPTLALALRSVIEQKTAVAKDEWSSLAPKLIERIRQIISVHYQDYKDSKTTNYIVNINTNVKEPRPEEYTIDEMITHLEKLLLERFVDSPPFTIVRIAELLIFDDSSAKIYLKSPVKFLRLLLLSFNVVTRLVDFEQKKNRASEEKSVSKTVPMHDGVDSKDVVMTKISWINEVSGEDDEDEDEDEDYEDSGSESNSGNDDDEENVDNAEDNGQSDVTDNDDSPAEIDKSPSNVELVSTPSKDTVNNGEDEDKLRNRQLSKLIQDEEDISMISPKNRKEQLDSPNVKRRKSDINLEMSLESGGESKVESALKALESALEEPEDVSMNSVGDEEEELDKDTDKNKEDVKMGDVSIEEK